MAKVSLEKEKIKYLLVKSFYQRTVDNLRATDYSKIKYYKSPLES